MFLEREEEGDAFAGAALGGNLPLVEIDAVLHDGEAKSRAPDLAASAFVDAIEAFKDSVDLSFWDANAVVGKAEIVVF